MKEFSEVTIELPTQEEDMNSLGEDVEKDMESEWRIRVSFSQWQGETSAIFENCLLCKRVKLSWVYSTFVLYLLSCYM